MLNTNPSQIEVPQPSPSPAGAIAVFFGGTICLVTFIMGVYANWSSFLAEASTAVRLLIVIAVGALCLALMAIGAYKAFLIWIQIQHAREDLRFKQAEARRADERHQLELHLAQTRLHADERGNRPYIYNPYTAQVLEIASGNFAQNVPSHYHVEYKPSTTHELQAGQAQGALPAAHLHIPTFAESLASGDIGPHQKDMLFCYEIIEDAVTGQTSLSPIRGEIGAQHTQFIVAGSGSGKSTFMAGNIAQAAAMHTLFYIIDPHKRHPEKSITAKVAAFQDWFILPSAGTHEEVARVLAHATRLRDALIQGKPTPYQGYHIMFIVDEVPALMAWQRSQEKQIKQLYINLALFMQSIGTQTAKFGMTGLFSSQFATKEELGEIEIRDACMSQFIMRLHPVQAQAMRVLGKETIREIPKLEKGHGFLMLSDSSEAMRVASGNVTPHDLAQLAAMLPPSPLVKRDAKSGRNEMRETTIIPFPTSIVEADETGLKGDRNEVRNQIEPALQAKLDKVLGLLGQNKPDILYAVWGVRPGKSQAYEEAKAEYEQIMLLIRDMARGA